MSKYLAKLSIFFMILSFSVLSHAVSDNKIIKANDYNRSLKSAIMLYKKDNYLKALPALELFARRGDKMAQYIVGTMYLNGQGSEQDLLKSYAWLTVANEQKSKAWLKPLEMLQEKLPNDFLVLAKEEGIKYIDNFGITTQRLSCKNVKTIGSRTPKHHCKNLHVRKGYFYINDNINYVNNST